MVCPLRRCGREGCLAVPPHLRHPGAGGLVCRAAARECLHAPAPDRLPSYRRLSRLADRRATRFRHRRGRPGYRTWRSSPHRFARPVSAG